MSLTDHFWERAEVAVVHVDCLYYNEFPCDLCLCRVLQETGTHSNHSPHSVRLKHAYLYVQLLLFLEQSLEVSHVIVLEVFDLASRGHQPLLDWETHSLIADVCVCVQDRKNDSYSNSLSLSDISTLFLQLHLLSNMG